MAWIDKYQSEIARAKVARQAGNEGMARVCARRAAGIVISEYLRRIGKNLDTGSAYDLIRYLKDQDEISSEVTEICNRLTLRVTPDYQLPVEADLISDVERLNKVLLA